MNQQRLHLVVGEVEMRHAFVGAARAHQRGDFGVGMGSHETKEGGRALGPLPSLPWQIRQRFANVRTGAAGDAGAAACWARAAPPASNRTAQTSLLSITLTPPLYLAHIY